MACEVIRCRGGVFVVWAVPEAEDMDRVGGEIFEAARDNGGSVFLARVPVGSPPPTEAAKRRFNQLFPQLLTVLSGYHVVMEGSGFFAAFKRATLTTLLQPFWRRRMFHVHAACGEVLGRVEPSQQAIVKNLLEQAAARGLLDNVLATSNSAPRSS